MNRIEARIRCTTQTPAVNLGVVGMTPGRACRSMAASSPRSRPSPNGWPAASLDLGCGCRRWAAVTDRGGLGREQLRAEMAGRVVAGVVGPAPPQDPDPAGAQAPQRPVLALAAGSGC